MHWGLEAWENERNEGLDFACADEVEGAESPGTIRSSSPRILRARISPWAVEARLVTSLERSLPNKNPRHHWTMAGIFPLNHRRTIMAFPAQGEAGDRGNSGPWHPECRSR